MTVSKKSASKTVHRTTSHHPTSEVTEEASPTPKTPPAESPTTSVSVTAAAKTALALLDQAQAALPLTAGLGAKARASALRLQMIPSDLLTEAANFLATNGSSYPFISGDAIQQAAQLEQALNQVVSAATTIVSRAKSTVLEQRGPAMEQALALYATLKARSRTDSSARDTVTRMEPLVNMRKTPHQRKQQRIKAKTKKVAELTASLAKEGSSSAPPEPVAATPAPVATPAAAPAAPAAPVSNGASAPPAASH